MNDGATSRLSFPVILSFAVLGTVAILAVGILRPSYLLPGVIGLAVVGLTPFIVQFVRRQAAVRAKKARAQVSYSVHSVSRIKSTIDVYNLAENPDIPELVDYLFQQAALLRASDVHLVPYKDSLRVRYRVDGMLADVGEISGRLREVVTNRLKVMSQAVTFVHDRPQDGRLDLMVGERDVDLRLAFMPTLHGERIVIRILDRTELGYGLGSLGFTTEQLATFQDAILRPQGMIILNGPAGSGKTTTIYGALRSLLDQSKQSKSIYTLEDPIEYDLMNINQTQIQEAQGFTFADGLRTMLRQDPDAIMVGEIRDLDTARIVVQAGMTGHLIITTVHATQAAGVFVRLVEMGVDAHSLASAVTAVVAQRLVRLLCPKCKRPTLATPGEEAKVGRTLAGQTFYAPGGCAACNQKGYMGRTGVFEVMPIGEALRELIRVRASPDKIQKYAVDGGMTTLIQNGFRLAQDGETSLEEVLRLLPYELPRGS